MILSDLSGKKHSRPRAGIVQTRGITCPSPRPRRFLKGRSDPTLFKSRRVGRGNRNCVLAVRSAVISCSNSAPEASSTTRTQTEPPLGGAAMNRVSTPLVAMAKLAPILISVGAPVPSFVTSCQRAWVRR